MTTKTEYNYPRAPLTVTTQNRKTIDFEVNSDGTIELMVTIEERYDLSTTMGEHYYRISPEDWGAIVAHIQKDLP